MFLFFLLFAGRPFPPNYDNFNISNSPIEIRSINDDYFTVKFDNDEYNFQYNETVNISGSSRANSISLYSISSHQIKIRIIALYLNMVSQIAFDISANGNVDLLIEGENFIKSEKEPAIHVSSGSCIHIHSDTNGTLECVSSGLSAAIGGKVDEFSGIIFIENIILKASTLSLYSLAGWGSSAIGGGGGSGKIATYNDGTINILIINSTVQASSDPFLGAAAVGSGGNSVPSFLNITVLNSIIIANSSIGAKSYDGHVVGEVITSGAGIGFGSTDLNDNLNISGEINIINSTVYSKGGDLNGQLINEPNHAARRFFVCGAGIGLGGAFSDSSQNSQRSNGQNVSIKISIDGSKVHANGGSSVDPSSFGGAGIGCGASYNDSSINENCGDVLIRNSIISAHAGNGIYGFGSSGIGSGGSLYKPLSIGHNLIMIKSEVHFTSQEIPLNETYAINVFTASLDEGSDLLAESCSTPVIKYNHFFKSSPILYINSIDMNNISNVNKICFISNQKSRHNNSNLFNLSSTAIKSVAKTLHPGVTFFVIGVDKFENLINYFVDENGKNIFYFDDKGMVIEQLTLINDGTPTPTKSDGKKIDVFNPLSLVIPLAIFSLFAITVIGVFIHARMSEREIVEDIIETNLVRYI